jgi:hypothetical protein
LKAEAAAINTGNVTLRLGGVVILFETRDEQRPRFDPSSLSAQLGLEEDTLVVAADTRRF